MITRDVTTGKPSTFPWDVTTRDVTTRDVITRDVITRDVTTRDVTGEALCFPVGRDRADVTTLNPKPARVPTP